MLDLVRHLGEVGEDLEDGEVLLVDRDLCRRVVLVAGYIACRRFHGDRAPLASKFGAGM